MDDRDRVTMHEIIAMFFLKITNYTIIEPIIPFHY